MTKCLFLSVLLLVPVSAQTASEWAARGSSHLEANRVAEAQSSFTESLKKNPNEFEALAGMGFLSFVREDFAEAKTYLERALTVRPQAFQSRFLLGAVFVQIRHPEAAVEHLRKAVASNPGHADARKLLAAQYVQLRKFREAIALLQPVVNLRPFDEETHLLLIEARQTSGDSAGAFALARTAAARFPSSAPVLAWLGFQLQFAGRYEEAKAPLQKAISLDADYPISLHVLGEVFLKQENYREAADWLGKAAAKLTGDVEILLPLARAQAGMDDAAASLATLRLAATVAPTDARVPLQLSRLYFALGDEAAARREAEKSVRLREANPGAATPPRAARRR